jgi:hypothetical protein
LGHLFQITAKSAAQILNEFFCFQLANPDSAVLGKHRYVLLRALSFDPAGEFLRVRAVYFNRINNNPTKRGARKAAGPSLFFQPV